MKTYFPLLLLLLATCTSSHQKNATSYGSFPLEKQLYAQTIELDTALFRYPFRLRIYGDEAVVLDLHGMDHFFHLFKYPSFEYLTSFGKRGDSPSEMLSAVNVRYTDDGTLWTLDANKSKLNHFTPSLLIDSLHCDERLSLDESLLRALDFAWLNDSTFIVPDYSGDARFCYIDRQGKLIRKQGVIPTDNDAALSNARPALAQAWRSFIDYHPKNGVLAAVTQLGEVLDVYNLKDSTHVVRIGPHGEPQFSVTDGYGIPTGIMGFSDVQVTDKAIYAVFHGRRFKDVAQQKQPGTDGGQFIDVFNLQGEPVCRYILDRYIYGIYVDEEQKMITATDVNSDQPIIQFSFD